MKATDPFAKSRQQFAKQPTTCSAISLIQSFGVCHRCYTRYTTVDRICDIITSGRMWLNRADSKLFDDAQELEKFGHYQTKKKLFYACFNFETAENAAMWGLYGPPTYQSIRISIGAKPLFNWIRQLKGCELSVWQITHSAKTFRKTCGKAKLADAGFNDIVYASVRKDENEEERGDKLFWNGAFTVPIPKLEVTKNCRCVTGFLKDYEWHFEQESRLWVRTENAHRADAVFVEVPDEVLKKMKFVLSPWCSKKEEQFVRENLQESYFKRFKNEKVFSESRVRQSYLSGALKKWAKNRGLG